MWVCIHVIQPPLPPPPTPHPSIHDPVAHMCSLFVFDFALASANVTKCKLAQSLSKFGVAGVAGRVGRQTGHVWLRTESFSVLILTFRVGVPT